MKSSINVKVLNTNKPSFEFGSGVPAKFLGHTKGGRFIFLIGDTDEVITTNYKGYLNGKRRITQEEPTTIEYLALYPNGSVYKKDCCPISQSSYGLENLIQIKVTRRGDKIIAKEFIDVC